MEFVYKHKKVQNKSDQETPIEKEIRLSKEREEELRREKHFLLSTYDSLEKSTSNSLTVESPAVVKPLIDSTKSINDSAPLAKGCMKKVVHKNTSGFVVKELESPRNSSDRVQDTVSNDKLSANKLDHSAKKSVPKLFTSSSTSYQKGLMKRFIAARGKINPTFTFSSSIATKANTNSNNCVPIDLSPPKVYQCNSDPNDSEKMTSLMGTRPGYVSVEDKIQVELQEMRRREKELKQQRNRMFIRSQPDLLHLLQEEEEDEGDHQEEPLKLRSAQSNPNLLDGEQVTKELTPQRKRNALIDVWENMIQKS